MRRSPASSSSACTPAPAQTARRPGGEPSPSCSAQAEHAADERRRIEAENAAKEKDRRAREPAAARKKHLDELAGTEPVLWKRVEELVATQQPKRYDEAVLVLTDLRDLAERIDGAGFHRRLEALRAEHARKPSLIARLHKAGL